MAIILNAESVEKMVLDFYSSGGEAGKAEQNCSLAAAQMSPEAWNFCWNLITDPEKAHHVQFFGASTLANKIMKCWLEVPKEHVEPLRKKLLDLLVSYRGPKIVITRLCVATAGVALHCIPHQWKDPIGDCIQGLANDSQALLLLELCTVIPQEFSTLPLSHSRKAEVKKTLTESVSKVLHLISQVLNGNCSVELSLEAVKCFQAWIQFGLPLDITIQNILHILLKLVENEELYEPVLDAITCVVSQPDSHRYSTTLQWLLKEIIRFGPLLNELLKDGNFEMAMPLASLFIAYGETHSRQLIDSATENEENCILTLTLTNIALNISGCPGQFPIDETFSELPFGFWFIFQDDIIASNPGQLTKCLALFSPIYKRLVDYLIKKSMYSPDDSKWTKDQLESFRCYRTDIGDCIMYCFNILRDDLFQMLLDHLDSAVASPNHWPYLEAVLYAWSSLAQTLAEEEKSPLLSKFVSRLPTLPYNNNVKVMSAALDCIGGFADWFSMHPEFLEPIISMLISALRNNNLTLCATMALKDIACECSEVMAPFAENIIHSCQDILDSNVLQSGECLRLMFPIGKLLSLLPPDKIFPRLEPIILPKLMRLQEFSAAEPSQEIKSEMIFILSLLSNLFATLDLHPGSEKVNGEYVQQPVAVIFSQLLPVLKAVAEKWSLDIDVSESICKLMKQTVSTLLGQVEPFVKEILSITTGCYRTQPTPAALDLCKQFFIMFGKNDHIRELLFPLLIELVNRTLAEISNGRISENADLVSSFFHMVGQILKKTPDSFFQDEPLLCSLFQCSIMCLCAPEVNPVKNSAFFLNVFILNSRNFSSFANVVNVEGEKLFMTLIRCIAGEAARCFTDYYADVLLVLNKKYFDNLCRWMNSFLLLENFPTDKVNRTQKERFARLVMKERSSKRRLLDHVKEFSLACAGLIGTEYAANMSQNTTALDRDDELLKNVQPIC